MRDWRNIADWNYQHRGKTPEEDRQWWRTLALALAAKKFPAFCIPAEWDDKVLDSPGAIDWRAAGGTDANMPSSFDDFYAAQYVLVIEELCKRAGLNRTKGRGNVFQYLEEHPAAKVKLPEPYKKRKTEGSLKEAFDSIRPEIRSDPRQYLPVPATISDGFKGDVPWLLIEKSLKDEESD